MTTERKLTTLGRKERSFKISKIPLILFEEVSKALGIGEEESVHFIQSGVYRMRKLNPDHKLVNAKDSAIGYRGPAFGITQFVFWFSAPSREQDFVSSNPSLIISGGPREGGIWTACSGQYMVEKLEADFYGGGFGSGLSLNWPVVPLVAMMLFRAHQLVINPKCFKESYWTKEHW